MSIGFNPPPGFDDADDVARTTAFRKRIDKSSPLKSPQRADHEGEIDTIVSPRDPQSGLPTGQVWDDTDIVHVVQGEASANMTYGDIEFDVVAKPELGDSGTHEVGHVRGDQDIEVENDETHFTERSGGPGHVRGVIQKRLPGTSADNFTYQRIEMENSVVDEPGSDEPSANMSLNFEEVKQLKYEFTDIILSAHAGGDSPEAPGDDASANVILANTAVTNIVQMENGHGDTAVDGDGIWQDDWETPSV